MKEEEEGDKEARSVAKSQPARNLCTYHLTQQVRIQAAI